MVTVAFPTAEAVTNAIMSLPIRDRGVCVARHVDGGFEVDAPDELAPSLRADHPVAPLPVVASITFKADLWRRCTDDEAAAIDEALKQAPVRQRRLFEDAQYLDHADEAFAFARDALIGLFDEVRAAELLAAS